MHVPRDRTFPFFSQILASILIGVALANLVKGDIPRCVAASVLSIACAVLRVVVSAEMSTKRQG